MQKAGKYEILRKIGAGGFGVVYEGRDPFIKRRVAIKTCTSEDEDVRQRFFREAEIAGNLQHRNIVTIHDFGFEEGVPYLVQEFLPGEDLSQMIARRDPISLGRKLDLLLQTAHGMAFAHSQGVIHRDIKPNNIRVLEDWRVKIMDFGIAKLANVESHLTKEGMTVGTAAYLPPEQIRGEKVDTRADIFSYGVLAYELLTYTRPFDGKTLSTLLYQILSQEPKPLLEVWPEAPPRVAKLVASCLEKDAAKRCQKFEIAETELAAAIADASVIDATNLIPQQPAAPAAATASGPPAVDARAELRGVSEKVRRAVAVGDLTAAELELTLAEKSWGRNAAFEEIVGPLRDEVAGARDRQDVARRRVEKLRLLLERGVQRLDSGEFAAARLAFEAALELDPSNSEGIEGISRADAGLAWEAAEAVRAAQAAEIVRAGAELLARDEPAVAAAKAREALALRADSADAAQLLAEAEDRLRVRAEEEARRQEEERRARAAADAERRRVAAAEALARRREEEAAEHERRRLAEAAELERRRAEEAARLERRRLELGEEVEALLARGAFAKVEKALTKGERELGVDVCAPWRQRLEAEREATAAAEERARSEAEAVRQAAREAEEAEKRAAQEAKRAAETSKREAEAAKRKAEAAKRESREAERARQSAAADREREAKRLAADEASRAKEEERRRAASAKADLARAKTVEATAGTQLPSASFASAKLSDPQTLKWIGGAAAGVALAVVAVWLVVSRRPESATSVPAAAPAVGIEERRSEPPLAPAPSMAQSAAETTPATEPAKPPTSATSAESLPAAPPPGVAKPAAPSPFDLALARGRTQLAAGDRRGALAAIGEALRIAPGDATALTLLGEMRRDEEHRVLAARQRALSAGADRLAASTYGEAESAAGRMTLSEASTAAVEAAWRAASLFEKATREANVRQAQSAAAATPALSPPPAQPAAAAPASSAQHSSLQSSSAQATAPAAAAAVPAPAMTAPSSADPVTAIRATLETYRAANEALDAGALAAVWTIDEAAKRQIAKAFAGYNSLSMNFENCSVQVDGDAATARCRVTQRIDVKVGSDLRSTQEVTFDLRREGDRWTIRSRAAR